VVPPVAIASVLLALNVGIPLEAAASPDVISRTELVTLLRQMIFGTAAPSTSRPRKSRR
jgi:hypothetical protein